MAKLFAVLSVILMAGIFTIAAAEQCICPIDHPQQKFCDSDFVFTGTVKSMKEVDGHLVYKLKVSEDKVFKGEEHINRKNKFVSVRTDYGTALCGRPNLELFGKYLISGKVAEDGRLEISFCTWVTQWDNVTPEQVKYLKKGTYAKHCDGECKITGVFSAHATDLNSDEKTFHESQLSGKWSRFNCAYNPMASVKFMSKDCENEFSFCSQDKITGMCMWKSNDNYEECFNLRETAWSLTHTGAAAFTSNEKCREIKSRRLRRKCLKTRKRSSEAVKEEAVLVLDENMRLPEIVDAVKEDAILVLDEMMEAPVVGQDAGPNDV